MQKKKELYPVIYKITNLVNGKIYIGSAKNYWNRMWTHISRLRNKTHCNQYLVNSWHKYGEDNFKFEVLEIVGDVKNLLDREQYYLDLFKPYDIKIGYNINVKASSTLGYKHTDETKKVMSLCKKGKSQSEEHKRKVQEWRKTNHPTRGKKGKDNKRSIPILQYDLFGNFVAEFSSISEAYEKTGIKHSNISLIINKKIKQCNKYTFFKKGEDIDFSIFPIKTRR